MICKSHVSLQNATQDLNRKVKNVRDNKRQREMVEILKLCNLEDPQLKYVQQNICSAIPALKTIR